MKLKHLLTPLAFVAMGLFATVGYAINTVTGVSAPATAAVGASVSISVQGDSGVCSTEIDYTTNNSWDASVNNATFPHGYSTAYTTPGVKTITAQGTGVCSGTATTTITITAPVPGIVTGVTAPVKAAPGATVSITVNGTGICETEIDFTTNGSWDDTKGPSVFPHSYSTTYTIPSAKTITVRAKPGGVCSGTKSINMTIIAGIVTGATAPATKYQGEPVSIQILGNGSCGAIVNWGDNSTTTVAAGLFPLKATKASYSSAGIKNITVAPAGAGCFGGANTSITIYAPVWGTTNISSVSGKSCATKGWPYKIKVHVSGGTGVCPGLIADWDLGSSKSEPPSSYVNLPHTPFTPLLYTHNYSTLGSKIIRVTGTDGCLGSKRKRIVVKRKCPGKESSVKLYKFDIWKKLPPLSMPCPSCSRWERQIRGHERQMKKFGAQRNRRIFNQHKASRAALIRKYNLQRRRAMKRKPGARKAPLRVPAKRMQMK